MSDEIIRVRTPATSANLGSGFDTLGMALSLCNIFDVVERLPRGQYRWDTLGEGAREMAGASSNMVVDSYEYACDKLGIEGAGFAMLSHNVIPLARGLGSSAGAVVAGVLLADRLNDAHADEHELLKIMTMIEGHPDNVVPCAIGGMTVSTWDGANLSYVRLPALPPDMHVVVAVPNVKVSTHMAREALPETVGFKDAVFNLSRAALLTAAWATGKWELLSDAMDDRLHQQYRSKLFPGGEEVMRRVREVPGCFGAAISGSGPSMLALVRGRPSRVAETMCRTFSEHGVDSLFFVLECSASGALVESVRGVSD